MTATSIDGSRGAGSALNRLYERTLLVLSSPRFLWAVIAVYVVFGIAFSLLVRWPVLITTKTGVEVPWSSVVIPDEDRHLGAILYYADRGFWRGPVISSFDPRYLSLGELQRTPSYFYYWVMSIPVDLLRLVTTDYSATVIMLRLVNVAIGALGLFVVWRILLMARAHPAVAGATVLALSLTGRYLWQGAGVTYDIPSTTLFFLFVYACLAVLTRGSVLQLVMVFVWAAFDSITKYTFLPFVAVGLVIVVVIQLRRSRPRPWRSLGRDFATGFREKRARFIAASALFVIAAVLFCERIIGNLIVYRSVDPGCTQLHTAAACSAFAIYRRNQNAAASYAANVASGQPPASYDPFTFTGEWLDRYYKSLYFDFGRTAINGISTKMLFLVAVVVIAVVIMVVVNRTAIVTTVERRFLAVLTICYLVGTYLVNLSTYLRYEQYFAFQGRYLLPIIPFIYAWIIAIVAHTWPRIPHRWRWILGIPLGLVALVLGVLSLHVVGFALYARGTDWYSGVAQTLIPALTR